MNDDPSGTPEHAPLSRVPATATPARRRPRRWPGLVALLALALTLVVSGVGFAAWHRYTAALAALEASQGALGREQTRLGVLVEELQAALREASQQHTAAQTAMLARQAELQDALESVRVFAAKGPKAWVLAEVEYLIRIADHQVQIRREPGAGATTLEAASRRLRDLADPALAPVREALAAKIDALHALPAPDIEGMATTLGELAQHIDTLPLRITPEPDPTAADDLQPAPSGPVQRSWDEALDTTWAGLRRLVTIRHHDRPADAVLVPKEQYFLRQGLRLRLEAARIALIQRYETAFRTDLAASRAWLEQYFDTDQPSTREVLATLQRLATTPINVPMPPIGDVLEDLHIAVNHQVDAVSPGEGAQ
jgi:uroporphyrin-3 C-methyltransferase